jgi:hypothetical protein
VSESINELLAVTEVFPPQDIPFLADAVEFLRNLEFHVDENFGRDTDSAYMMFWIAFGQVMVAIRRDDEIERMRNSMRAIPRSFFLSAGTAADMRRELVEAEGILEDRDNDVAARLVLKAVTQSVEELCKRMWPVDFADGRRSGDDRSTVGSVLGKRLRDRGPNFDSENIDDRFAQIAMTLHRCYRNPASHYFAFKRCRSEAKFVLSALNALVDLVESTQASVPVTGV